MAKTSWRYFNMVGLLVTGILAVVVAGPRAFKNILGGTHDYADGFSIEYRKDAAKYKEEMYKK